MFKLKSCIRRKTDSIDKRFCFDIEVVERSVTVWIIRMFPKMFYHLHGLKTHTIFNTITTISSMLTFVFHHQLGQSIWRKQLRKILHIIKLNIHKSSCNDFFHLILIYCTIYYIGFWKNYLNNNSYHGITLVILHFEVNKWILGWPCFFFILAVCQSISHPYGNSGKIM